METVMTLETLSDQEVEDSVKAHREDFHEFIEVKVLPQLKHLVEKLKLIHPCKQYQMALMDVISMAEHFQDRRENGPEEPFQEISLEKTVIAEEHPLFT